MSPNPMGRVSRELLKKQLGVLGEVAGVQRVVLFSTDGFEIASFGTDPSASARLAAIGSSLTALGSAIASEAGLRDFHRTMIESEDGAVVIMRVGAANTMSLAVVASRSAVLGQLLWATKECCQALAKVVSQ